MIVSPFTATLMAAWIVRKSLDGTGQFVAEAKFCVKHEINRVIRICRFIVLLLQNRGFAYIIFKLTADK
jgi:Na+/H+ antiporter NhaD/arsenite permease-like protein